MAAIRKSPKDHLDWICPCCGKPILKGDTYIRIGIGNSGLTAIHIRQENNKLRR